MSTDSEQTTVVDWLAESADLTDEERAIYEAVELGETGLREYARRKGWSSSGTASNLLRRAREKVRA